MSAPLAEGPAAAPEVGAPRTRAGRPGPRGRQRDGALAVALCLSLTRRCGERVRAVGSLGRRPLSLRGARRLGCLGNTWRDRCVCGRSTCPDRERDREGASTPSTGAFDCGVVFSCPLPCLPSPLSPLTCPAPAPLPPAKKHAHIEGICDTHTRAEAFYARIEGGGAIRGRERKSGMKKHERLAAPRPFCRSKARAEKREKTTTPKKNRRKKEKMEK